MCQYVSLFEMGHSLHIPVRREGSTFEEKILCCVINYNTSRLYQVVETDIFFNCKIKLEEPKNCL